MQFGDGTCRHTADLRVARDFARARDLARAGRGAGDAAGDQALADPVRGETQAGDGRVLAAALWPGGLAAAPPARDRRAHCAGGQRPRRLRHLRARRPRRRAARAAQRLLALRDRQLGADLPPRQPPHPLPPHRRPQLDRDRDRARRLRRRRRPGGPAPAAPLVAPPPVASLKLPDSGPRRDRARREPQLALPPRAGPEPATADPRRLATLLDAGLPAPAATPRPLPRLRLRGAPAEAGRAG